MKLVEVEDIRLIKRDWSRYRAGHKQPVSDYIDKFMTMNVKTVRVDYEEGEYLNPNSCAASFRGVVSNNYLPIEVKTINGEVYLVRTDIPHPRRSVCEKGRYV